MRTTQYLLSTIKEIPSGSEIVSHQLMIRAGMIRQLASGLYTWLPTGLRVLKKIENIVREEMINIGAVEISMPIIQPANLWQVSGRLKQYGSELLHLIDRRNRHFIIGPTHEEIITHLMRNELNSYKQLPINLFQIQVKFRDEVRPRFGIMRSREFLMKDAYSFHTSQVSLQETYNAMHQAYKKSFSRMGLDFFVVQADTGSIGGNISHEFHILAEDGEDNIVFSTESNYAANIELAEAVAPIGDRPLPSQPLIQIDTPNIKTISDLVNQFNFSIEKTIKTLIVKANKNSGYKLVALLIRGDHELNIIKAEKNSIVSSPLSFATEEEIRTNIGIGLESLGPVGLDMPIIADRTVAKMSDFIAGANISGKHFIGINWGRDLVEPLQVADLRNVVEGDPSPDGKGLILIKRGIEIGHIFQLGTKYTKALKAKIQDEYGQNQTLTMGCYGIGITRIVAAAIEQNHDERGIIWPTVLAPFQIAILPINMHKSTRIKNLAEWLYKTLCTKGIEVLLEDREERFGVIFSDIELIGIPHIIILSDRALNNNKIEYKSRRTGKKQIINTNRIIDFLLEEIQHYAS